MQPALDFTKTPRFDGADIQPQDHARLAGQMARVYEVMAWHKWWTVGQIAESIWQTYCLRDPEPSISAQIRNLRKPRFGGHVVERKREKNLTYYRLVRP